MNNDEIIKKAVSKFGEDEQMLMAIEECAELIAAINHYRRNRLSKVYVCEEIADVSIMIDQLRCIFGNKCVGRCINEKMKRLEGRLDKK